MTTCRCPLSQIVQMQQMTQAPETQAPSAQAIQALVLAHDTTQSFDGFGYTEARAGAGAGAGAGAADQQRPTSEPLRLVWPDVMEAWGG